MPMLLKSYQNTPLPPLPPEGSEEWLAMLPGWSGWHYQTKETSTISYLWLGRYDVMRDFDVLYFNIYEGKTGDASPPWKTVGDVRYVQIGGYYYFRGAFVKKGNGFSGNVNMDTFYIARATSLTPQR